MKAFILAAGAGTRLKPATDTIPKALIRIGDYTLLEIVIRRLAGAGFRSIVINVHHFADQILKFLAEHGSFGMEINISDETEELLDTGGALKKAREWFHGEEDVLVHNIDILSDLNLQSLISRHRDQKSLITLAVKERPTTRNLLIDNAGRLCGWEYPEKNISILTRDNRKGLKTTAFSGVYVFSARLFDLLPEQKVFGFTPWILDLAANEKIMTWDQGAAFWYEAGRTESVELAARSLEFDPQDSGFIREKKR